MFSVRAESTTPPSHWSPGPGLIGNRGSGFGGSEDWPDGAHAAYQQLFDRVHPTHGGDGADTGDTGGGQGVVPLDARQHSQESVHDVRRMTSAGSRGSGSGSPPNSAASHPWDSMSPPKYTLTHSTASLPHPPQAPVHKVLLPLRPAPHCLPLQPDSGYVCMSGHSCTLVGITGSTCFGLFDFWVWAAAPSESWWFGSPSLRTCCESHSCDLTATGGRSLQQQLPATGRTCGCALLQPPWGLSSD